MFKPMRAAKATSLDQITYPVLGAPKYNGIRCTFVNGVAYSKKMKPLPSGWLQTLACTGRYDGFDGEVLCGPETDPLVWNRSNSFCMSREVPEELMNMKTVIRVFDDHTVPDMPKQDRVKAMNKRLKELASPFFKPAPYKILKDLFAAAAYEEQMVATHYEGAMFSSPRMGYKYGTSTMREQGLMKFKRFHDAEAVIIGYKQEMLNTNAAEKNELGNTKRSSAKAGKVGKEALGAWMVEDLETGVQFDLPTSTLTKEQKAEEWKLREKRLGKYVTYKYQTKDAKTGKPIFPTFLHFRNAVEVED